MSVANSCLTLAICSIISFLIVMAQYAFISSNPVSSRLGYAVFSSVVPAIAALLVRSRIKTVERVLLYVGLFVLVQITLWIF